MTDTSIEWTDVTWNPVRGCTRVSEGCRNCYAETMAARNLPEMRSPTTGQAFALRTAAGPRWTGAVELIPSKLDEPLRWRKPRRVFVNSMSDLFHEALPFVAVSRVFERMAFGFVLVCRKTLCNCECEHDPENYSPDADAYTPRCRCWREVPEHTFQILTKRPARMLEFFEWLDRPHEKFPDSTNGQVHAPTLSFTRAEADWPLPNVWLGVSVEDQATADERIPLLLQAPAAKRFVSYEPALGPVDFRPYLFCNQDPRYRVCPQCLYSTNRTDEGRCPNDNAPLQREDIALDWIIVGGESGPGARGFDYAWARSAVEQCRAAGVAVFVKQMGSSPYRMERQENTNPLAVSLYLNDRKGGDPSEWPEDLRVREFPGDAR